MALIAQVQVLRCVRYLREMCYNNHNFYNLLGGLVARLERSTGYFWPTCLMFGAGGHEEGQTSYKL